MALRLVAVATNNRRHGDAPVCARRRRQARNSLIFLASPLIDLRHGADRCIVPQSPRRLNRAASRDSGVKSFDHTEWCPSQRKYSPRRKNRVASCDGLTSPRRGRPVAVATTATNLDRTATRKFVYCQRHHPARPPFKCGVDAAFVVVHRATPTPCVPPRGFKSFNSSGTQVGRRGDQKP